MAGDARPPIFHGGAGGVLPDEDEGWGIPPPNPKAGGRPGPKAPPPGRGDANEEGGGGFSPPNLNDPLGPANLNFFCSFFPGLHPFFF